MYAPRVAASSADHKRENKAGAFLHHEHLSRAGSFSAGSPKLTRPSRAKAETRPLAHRIYQTKKEHQSAVLTILIETTTRRGKITILLAPISFGARIPLEHAPEVLQPHHRHIAQIRVFLNSRDHRYLGQYPAGPWRGHAPRKGSCTPFVSTNPEERVYFPNPASYTHSPPA